MDHDIGGNKYMVGPYSKDNTPTLFQLLETGNFCTDDEGKPSTCDVCPLSTLVDGQGDISHDPSEAYYICRMMNGKEVWGEDPCCTITQWREMAKEELLRSHNAPHPLTYSPASANRKNVEDLV